MGGKHNSGLTVGDVMEQARQQALKGGPLEEKLSKMLICCGCLGDRSDDTNEIVECDGCGVSVHEGITLVYVKSKIQVKFFHYIYIYEQTSNFRLLWRIRCGEFFKYRLLMPISTMVLRSL